MSKFKTLTKVTKQNLSRIIDLVVGLVYIYSHPQNHQKQMKNNKANENLNLYDTENQTAIKPAIPSKNKWLYPTDGFGVMEKGVEFESKTYVNDEIGNDTNDFTII